MDKNKLIEKLADLEHDRWSNWMKHLFSVSDQQLSLVLTALEDGSVVIPAKYVKRWKDQMNTPYKDLSEEDKEKDRREVRRTIEILENEGIL